MRKTAREQVDEQIRRARERNPLQARDNLETALQALADEVDTIRDVVTETMQDPQTKRQV